MGCWFLAGTKVSPVTNTLCTLDTLVRSCVLEEGEGREGRGGGRKERGRERGEGERGRGREGKRRREGKGKGERGKGERGAMSCT